MNDFLASLLAEHNVTPSEVTIVQDDALTPSASSIRTSTSASAIESIRPIQQQSRWDRFTSECESRVSAETKAEKRGRQPRRAPSVLMRSFSSDSSLRAPQRRLSPETTQRTPISSLYAGRTSNASWDTTDSRRPSTLTPLPESDRGVVDVSQRQITSEKRQKGHGYTSSPMLSSVQPNLDKTALKRSKRSEGSASSANGRWQSSKLISIEEEMRDSRVMSLCKALGDIAPTCARGPDYRRECDVSLQLRTNQLGRDSHDNLAGVARNSSRLGVNRLPKSLRKLPMALSA